MTHCKTFVATIAAFVAITFAVSSLALGDDVIAKYDGSTSGSAGGHQVTMIGVTLMSNGKTVRIAVPNEPGKKGTPAAPKKELEAAIKKLNVGDIVKLTVDQTPDLGPALSAIEPYEMKPGEDTPNGYVFAKTFDKTVGKNTLTSIVLTKFGAEHNFTIAMHKGENGQEQDPDVVAAIGKLTEGSPVWVQTQGKTVITAIEPYTEPMTGKVGKIAEVDVDEHKVKSAEIATDDGKTVTVMVPGKVAGKAFVPDALVAGQLARIKVGSQVQFRIHEDGDKLWLREIEVVKPGAKKPVEKAAPPAKK